METPESIKQLFSKIDQKDAEGFASFVTENAHFKFGNAPEVVGKQNIQEAVANFFGSIQEIRHNIIATWSVPGTVICQGEVTYTRMDNNQVTLPFVNIFGMDKNLIDNYLIYIDITPLYA